MRPGSRSRTSCRLFGTKKKLFLATIERCMADTLELFRAAAGDLRGADALEAMGDASSRC